MEVKWPPWPSPIVVTGCFCSALRGWGSSFHCWCVQDELWMEKVRLLAVLKQFYLLNSIPEVSHFVYKCPLHLSSHFQDHPSAISSCSTLDQPHWWSQEPGGLRWFQLFSFHTPLGYLMFAISRVTGLGTPFTRDFLINWLCSASLQFCPTKVGGLKEIMRREVSLCAYRNLWCLFNLCSP